VLNWVGGGRGCYIQETNYKYVGHGAGDFDAVKIGGGYNGCWCIGLSSCLGLLMLAALLAWLFWPVAPTLPHDCNAGFSNWQAGWSPGKQDWCCQHTGKGCTTTMPPPLSPVPTPPPTVAPVVTTRAPPTPPPETTPNKCNMGGVDTWSEETRAYCCTTYHNGCPTPPPPPAPVMPYDCNAGFENWKLGWSVGKKAWCCQHTGRGCAVSGGCETTSAPYDCNAGFANWVAGWSAGKKQWCCVHTGKGCPPKAGGCA